MRACSASDTAGSSRCARRSTSSAACAALAVVMLGSGSTAWPAIPLAPLLLVGVSQVLGLYGSPDSALNRMAGFQGRPFLGRLVITALFAWTASLLIASHGSGLGVIGQLALWILALMLGGLGGMATPDGRAGFGRRRRWLVVGDDETAERLKAYEPLRDHAKIVHSVLPPAPTSTSPADREAALRMVDDHRADRVVIAARTLDDKGLVAMIKTFRSLGVPVSLLPHPLDLLEAPAAEPVRLGGVPLDPGRVPRQGGRGAFTRARSPSRPADASQRRHPDIERGREPPACHEQLPEASTSSSWWTATRPTGPLRSPASHPSPVVGQSGRGKGNALRAGFAP